MEWKLVSYWLLSLLGLAVSLYTPNTKVTPHEYAPVYLTSIFDVEPRFLYYVNGKYHANVKGQLKLAIKTESIKNNLADFDTLVIQGLSNSLNTELSLNWKVGNQAHQIPLNNTSTSINQLDFTTNDSKQISDLYLLFKTNTELGNKYSLQNDVSFQSIYFDTQSNQNTFSQNTSQWLNFNPVKIHSINGYTNNDNPHFSSMILRISIWVLFSVALFIVFKPNNKHLIITLVLAWLFTLIPFSINHYKQHQHLKSIYDSQNTHINLLDQNLFDIAEDIKTVINNDSQLSNPLNRLVIIGLNNFSNLRLFHHLLDYNVAIHISLNKLLKSKSSKDLILIFIEKQMRHCKKTNNSSKENVAKSELELDLIHLDHDFCIMVIK